MSDEQPTPFNQNERKAVNETVEKIKTFAKEHKFEIALAGSLAVFYGGTIVAASAIAGRTAAVKATQIVRRGPVTISVPTESVVKDMLPEIVRQIQATQTPFVNPYLRG